jgi:dihydroneopterin triphosphate diphosphatase
MSRAAFQVLVLPFRASVSGGFEFGALRREDDGNWQGVAGGGEDGETPEVAAVRETLEEAGIPSSARFYRLQSQCSVPTYHFAARRQWPADLFVIPEYSFAVECPFTELRLSGEHAAQAWGSYDETFGRLRWDSNRTALWELDERLRRGLLPRPIEL